MKNLFLIILLFGLSCNQFEPENKNEKRQKQISILVGYFGGCQFKSSNPLFVDPYYGKYISDQKQYEKLILGDSTMDIACNSFANYTSLGTGCFPVSGNKIPDFESQLCVLSSISPSAIIISTMGGNDLLSQVPDNEIIERGKLFANSIEKKFPSAKKIWVKVHPTRDDYANEHRGKTNKVIGDYITNLGWNSVDPDSCFATEWDGKASQLNLLDAIHPNSQTSFCIKNKILSETGISY